MTNNLAEVQARQRESGGIGKFFERSFSADSVKVYKPSPQTYAHVENELGARPSQLCMAEVEDGNRILVLSSGVSDGMISVAIADTGGGISPAERERVFETLYTTKGAGLGLGLSICRKIVKLHGGQLWVEENGRCGARFIFALPLRQAVQTSESR